MYDHNPTLYLKRKKQLLIDMGVETLDFAVKNKHIMRKIEQENVYTGEVIIHNQIKPLRRAGFSQIFSALKTSKPHKGFIFRYAE